MITMTAEIIYDENGETKAVERDAWHDEKDGFVVAYNESHEPGIEDKVTLPINRVIRIDE